METETEAFDARIDLLAGELELAIKWDRPSILLAVYASEFVRMEAQQALAGQIREFGATVSSYAVSGEEDADIPLALARHPDRKETVFFVSGLRWGGGKDGRNAYRALNLRREYFVEYRIRAVFWLTESEAARLPHVAPDFWAFRHRAVEFVEAPQPEQIAPVARALAWSDWSDRTLKQNTEAKIALREGLLRDLPESDETLSARADLLYTLGTLYYAKQEYERALEYFKQALAIFRRLADTERQSWCWNDLGNVYYQQGRYTEAIAAYRKATDLDPEDAASWNGLGNIYYQQGRYAEAIAAYRKANELDPEEAYPWNGLGNVYADLGRYEDAEDVLRQAIALDPDDAYPYNSLGIVYRHIGRYADAEAVYHKAIDLDPEYAYPWNGLGNIYSILGRYEEAIAAYRRAINIDSNYAYAWNGLGNVYADLGRYKDAEDALRQAIDLDSENADYHNNLGQVYLVLGRYEEAEAAFHRAINLGTLSDQKLAIVHYSLGNVYRTLGRYADAEAAYRHAIDLDPDNAVAYISLAAVLQKLGRDEEAEKHLSRARALMANESDYNKACLEAIAGNLDAAMVHLKQALAQAPGLHALAARDPDLESLHGDPRFEALVGGETKKSDF